MLFVHKEMAADVADDAFLLCNAGEMTRKICFGVTFSCVAAFLGNSVFLNQKMLLLENVLRVRNTRYVNFYNCWKHPDTLRRINQFFNGNNIRAKFQKIGTNASYDFKNQNPTNHAFAYVLDSTCKDMEGVLFQFNSKHEFKGDRKWYVLREEDLPERNVAHLFERLRLRMDSDVLLLIYKLHGLSVSLSIVDLHNPGGKPGNTVISTALGNSADFLRALNSVRYKKRSDMTGVTLKISLEDASSIKSGASQGSAMGKLNLALIFLLQSIHNFSALLVPAGKTNDSSQLFHIQGAMVFINEEVVTSRDLLIPAYPYSQCFIYKRSETTKNEYLAPFSSTVWYCVISLAILVCVVMKLVLHLEEENERSGEFSWTTAFLILVSVYSQQGTSIVPTSTAGRIVILCLLIISVHLYNSYVSTIVSSLLYPSVSTYNNPDELINDNFQLGFEKVDFNPYLKYNSVFAFTDADIRYKNKRFRYYDAPEGLRNVRRGQFAFHTEAAVHYPAISKSFDLSEICDLQEFDAFPKLYPTLVASKHSQFSKLFKISSRRIVERGILQREIASLLAQRLPCLGMINVKRLSIKYVFPAFILLGVGVVAAMVSLLLELGLSCALKREMESAFK